MARLVREFLNELLLLSMLHETDLVREFLKEYTGETLTRCQDGIYVLKGEGRLGKEVECT